MLMHIFLRVMAYGLILYSSSMTGFAISKNYMERTRQLQHLIASMQVLLTEIVYSATPLPEALKNASRMTTGIIGGFLNQASLVLGEMHTAQVAWDVSLQSLTEKSALLGPDLEVLKSLGSVLGVSNRDDQQRHLLTAIKRLETLHQSAVLDAQRNERLWRYLGVMVGVVLIIILI